MEQTFSQSRVVRELVRHSVRPGDKPGPGVISLAQGDPDFPTPEHICEALADAVASGATHYAAPQGSVELRAALADHISRGASRRYAPEQVVVTHGANAGLAAVILATIDPGQRVIVPQPTYSLYADLIRMAGGEVVFVEHRHDMHLDLDAIADRAPGARMVIICNPCNPTGTVLAPPELERLAAIACDNDLLVVCDEVYDRIVFDQVRFASALELEGLARRLIYVQSFSKTYAMTGWRIGYVASGDEVAAAVARVHRTLNGPVNSAVQQAALVALTEPDPTLERMRREYQARRDIVAEMLDGVEGVELILPAGTFYAFVGYAAPLTSVEVVRKALELGVAVRPGIEFGPGGEGFVRISFSIERQLLVEGVARLLSVFAMSDAATGQPARERRRSASSSGSLP